ncbi:MAG TPA: heparinase II/III family protein [Pyrinomonadaceae bacterium]
MKEDSTIEIGGNGASVYRPAEKPLRILVVAPSFDILGGQAVQAARLISRLRELPFFEVGFLAINPRLPGVLRKLQTIKYLRTVVTSLLYIATLLVRIPKFDVIHVFSASYFSFVLAPMPAILIGRLYGKKVLLNYHSGEAEDHLTRWRRSAVATIRLAHVVAVPSEYLVRVFSKFGVQARAINNLIELDQFTFRERDPLRPLFLSNRNLETHYGVDHVLRAFALIQKQVPDTTLVVAGDGGRRVALEDLAKELGLRNTSFIGRVEHDEIVEQYHQADIYLNGSEIDNQPLSILEAFSCGLPVVTTNAGGIPDMVTDGETGFVVNQQDYKAIADRAMQLLREPRLAASIVQAAREECEKYSWRVVRGRWLKVYSELGNGHRQESRPVKGGVAEKIGRLRRMTLAELRVRSSQAILAFLERRGWSSLTKLPSARGLRTLLDSSVVAGEDQTAREVLEQCRARSKQGLLAAFSEPDATVSELRSRWPEAEQQIVAQADRIIAGSFDLLGFRDLNFGDPINWHFEPVSGKSSPALHWSRLNYLDANTTGDNKIVWELNRHQYFLKLGQAYWLTRDEKYATAFVAHLSSWMDQNPPKVGINWASSLEVAFRSISWLWALQFFQNSPALSAEIFTRALKFLYLNARHLETYLSTYFSPNTHLTGEAVGLYYLGTLLPEFKEAPHWRAKGQEILVRELAKQVKPDGVYFEQSSYYHRYTADFYTHLLILSRASMPNAGPGLHQDVEEKLKALLDHLMYITRPDGTTPLFGDDDGGRLLSFDARPANDFRATLSTGAVMFGRGDYKFVAGEFAEETLWLLGPKSARVFDSIKAEEPSLQSKDFPDGGYYVMRDGWHRKANYLLFDCGPHGTSNCGHAHADALAIELTVNGQPTLVDPGTYTYTGSKEARDLFRSSSSHNVLTVDSESSSLPAGPFSWKTIARCEPLSWINQRRFDFVAGRHNGYERLANPATHTRSILFLKGDYWLMRDRLSGNGAHDLDLQFHFAAGVDPQIKPGNPAISEGEAVEVSGKQARLQVVTFGQKGHWGREEGWVSHCYGLREAARVCTYSTQATADRRATEGNGNELISLLLPSPGGILSKFEVRELEAIGGLAFEIVKDEHSDLVMIRDPHVDRVETVRMVSDSDWTWARFLKVRSDSRDEVGELLELLVLGGQRLELNGKEILKSAKRVDYLVASRTGDRFQVETSEGRLNLSFPIWNLEQLFAEASLPEKNHEISDLKSEISKRKPTD